MNEVLDLSNNLIEGVETIISIIEGVVALIIVTAEKNIFIIEVQVNSAKMVNFKTGILVTAKEKDAFVLV